MKTTSRRARILLLLAYLLAAGVLAVGSTVVPAFAAMPLGSENPDG